MSIPSDKGNTDTAGEGLVDLSLILKLGMLGLDGLELNGDLFARDDVDPEIAITYRWALMGIPATNRRRTERAGTYLLAQSILASNAEIQTMRG